MYNRERDERDEILYKKNETEIHGCLIYFEYSRKKKIEKINENGVKLKFQGEIKYL